MLTAATFLIGAALGAGLVLAWLSPGPWPPERRASPRRLAKERDSWLR